MAEAFTLPAREPHEPNAAYVLRALRMAIVTHRVEPGQMLSEQEIARRFAISRQPVREAFIKLSEAGLVRVLPQRGTQVARISLAEVGDARFVRQAVEIALAAEAARQITGVGAKALAAHIRAQLAAAEEAEQAAGQGAEAARERFYFLDEAFHADLARIAERPASWKMLETVKAQMDRVRFLAIERSSPLEAIIAQHRAIVDAVSAGDAAAAAAAMEAHLSSILGELPELRRLYPSHFAEEG
ncbi:GntR family transcriptional regulator [Solirhodobacter olei]|uniref:GntR family transcriptional regulator n=1 Tax=Solirhodobacter olei TaxID=2493082 RepID=UPI000FD8F3CF|nr:GntR family transcriptional regulator [Solirhodobacter olei]